jgi:hypothetical protein
MRGSQWEKVALVMFNVYFDDSGTAPDQRIAIASAGRYSQMEDGQGTKTERIKE